MTTTIAGHKLTDQQRTVLDVVLDYLRENAGDSSLGPHTGPRGDGRWVPVLEIFPARNNHHNGLRRVVGRLFSSLESWRRARSTTAPGTSGHCRLRHRSNARTAAGDAGPTRPIQRCAARFRRMTTRRRAVPCALAVSRIREHLPTTGHCGKNLSDRASESCR